MRRRRVVILGGGCGGVAAAWALSRTPELRRALDVTLVQPGFRLGGKGATGRDPARAMRIHEHGLHLWLGFYRHAFTMIRDVYDAWDRPSEGPLRSLESAFSPLSYVSLVGGTEGAPELWKMRFPERPGRPWDDAVDPLRAGVSTLASLARSLPDLFVGAPGWTIDRARVLAALGAAIARGLLLELRGTDDAAWMRLDGEDLRAWLRRHGASDAAADAPPVRALYDLGFAYPDGVAGASRGEMAAGAGVRCLLQIFLGYRGAPFYRMNAGMGDTIFAPGYEVLRARGIDVRFFHRVDRLRLQGRAIGAIELAVQARGAERYRPLVRAGALRVWPDAPLRDRLSELAPGDPEADEGASLGTITLLRERDFDDVILAIPSTAHRRFASELIDSDPRYRAMVEHTTAVPTVAAQWWLTRAPRALGWDGVSPLLTGIPGLFRTWADLGEVIDTEDWPARPATVAYFCHVAPPELHATTDRAAAAQWVRDRMRAWASGPLLDVWPGARTRGGFDEGALHAPEGGSPWDPQYARANVASWERYVLTLPGSTRHRLAPGDSGFDNLFLAGDWTRTAINGGSVEAAVSSGIEAARAARDRA